MPSERYATYVEQCRVMHATRKILTGNGVLKHRDFLFQINAEADCHTGLDYGCGKCLQFETALADGRTLEETLGYAVAKYDPAVPGLETLPEGPFDLVWCTDVLEYIPEEDIGDILAEIGGLAAKAVFITVSTYPTKKFLPNGENARVTLKPRQWWTQKFAATRRRYPALRIETLIG